MISEKIKELQEIFDGLRPDEQEVEITDGKYFAKLLKTEQKVSAKGKDYIQMTFKVDGYFPVYKRLMTDMKIKDTVTGRDKICMIARNFGKLTDDLSVAVEYLNTLKDVVADITISNSDKDFYEVAVANIRREN